MEQKDFESLVHAVAQQVNQLNKSETNEKPTDTKTEEKDLVETFNCPECSTKVSAMSKHCPSCGCELEWEG